MTNELSGNKIAVLIDGDNAESRLVEQFITEAGKYGRVTVKRIYADWTSDNMKTWKEQLNKFSIKPIQKFAYTKGKSSTDTALIIEAMDLLHSKLVDGFCIVSSDSDFTGLAERIREEGMFIMGIGKSHTPEAFIKACERFTFSEILSGSEIKTTLKKDGEKKEERKPAAEKKNLDAAAKEPKAGNPKVEKKIDLHLIGSLKNSGIKSIDLKQIDSAFQMVVDLDTGQALLSQFSHALRKVDPTFDHRNFGYSSFRKFCDALMPNYETVLHDDQKTLSLKKKT